LFGLKDTGSARISVNGLTASAMLIPRAAPSDTIVVDVGEVEVAIEGPCRLRTEGSTADWAYNAAAVILKPLIVSYVKDAIRGVVETSLALQLRGWTAWSAPAPPEPPSIATVATIADVLDDGDAPLEAPAAPELAAKTGDTKSAAA
jgi:hypothetical protein